MIAQYGDRIEFVAPDDAFNEARIRLPEVLEGRNLPPESFLAYSDSPANVIRTVEPEVYSVFESIARQRIARRDENDWPILATALALRCPIWTEDTDFFGCGAAT